MLMCSTYLNDLIKMFFFFRYTRFRVYILLKITQLIPSRQIVEFFPIFLLSGAVS